MYPQGHIDRAALLDRLKRLHEVEGIQINNGACAEQREYVSLQTTEHGPRMARRPLHGNFLMPVQGNAFECLLSDKCIGLGLLLERNRINALTQNQLSLQTLLSNIC